VTPSRNANRLRKGVWAGKEVREKREQAKTWKKNSKKIDVKKTGGRV
jgi:hypothetical protein